MSVSLLLLKGGAVKFFSSLRSFIVLIDYSTTRSGSSKRTYYRRQQEVFAKVQRDLFSESDSTESSQTSIADERTSYSHGIINYDEEQDLNENDSPSNISEEFCSINDDSFRSDNNITFDDDSDIEENGGENYDEIDEPEENLKEALGNAFIKAELGMNQINIILRALRPFHPDLPLSYKTILDTPVTGELEVLPMAGGEYIGFNLQGDLKRILLEQDLDKITLNVNIDGVPVAKSTQWQFCVITTLVKEMDESFISGVYHGKHKPVNQDQFVAPYVMELDLLMKNGLHHNGKTVPVFLQNAVLDSIGRAPLLKIKHPSGFFSCHKCKVRGEKIQLPPRKASGRKGTFRMSFPPDRYEERTDSEFRSKTTYVEKNGKPTKESHHMSKEPCEFEKLNVDIVKCFAIDYMHCALLGLPREMIKIWTDTIKDFQQRLDANLEAVRGAIPSDFQRKCRDSGETWKANEVRLFVNYISYLVLKDVLPDHLYTHFLKFVSAIRIMCSREIIEEHIEIAEILMHEFVVEFRDLYPSEPITYNLHCCDHLAQECRDHHGTLDDFSAFFGENQLQIMKRWYKTGRNPLIQIGRRCSERKAFGKKYRNIKSKDAVLGRRIHGSHNYRSVQTEKFNVSVKNPNNVVFTKDFIMFISIIKESEQNDIILEGPCIPYSHFSDIFDAPISSKLLNMFKVRDDYLDRYGQLQQVSIDNVSGKCMMYKSGGFFYIMKLLHW